MTGGIIVILPAAGSGSRLGGISKPLIEIGGRTILSRVLSLFAGLTKVKKICIAAPTPLLPAFQKVLMSSKPAVPVELVEGGSTRAYSVRNAFEYVKPILENDDLVCIHDAARPLLSKADLDSVIAAGFKHGAAFLAVKIKDTLKVVGDDHFCMKTVDRKGVYGAQTPQVMFSKYMAKAYDSTPELTGITDEIMLVERIGVRAYAVQPEHFNPKLTTPEDLEVIRKLIA